MRIEVSLRILAATLAALLASACGSNDDHASSGTVRSDVGGGGAGTGGSGGSGGAGAGPLALAPGEVAELTVTNGATGTELATPNGDEKFVVILGSMLFDTAAKPHPYAIALTSPPADASATLVEGCSLTSTAWSDKPLPSETPPSGTAANIGDTRTLSIGTPTGTTSIQAQAIAVGKNAVVWADVSPTNPAVLDAATVNDFLTSFETTILPRARSVFGVESDVDHDGHIGLVFSPVTYETAVAFFTGCDLKLEAGCGAGNQGEFLYLTPPNAIDPPYNTPAAIKEILAHELSHMIHFNRKVLRNDLTSWFESSYMIEGVGGFSQDVLGFQAGNLYVTMAGLDGIDDFTIGKTLVNGAGYDPNRDGVLRGDSYLFVRWFYDRAGGDQALADGTIQSKGGPALLRTLLDAPSSIADGLPTLAGAPIEDLAIDYFTALAMSNRDVIGESPPKNACFSYLPTATDPVTAKQRGANLYAMFHTQQMQGPKLQSVAQADGKLIDGGVELIELDASAGASALAFSVTADAAAKPRVRIGRIH